MNEKDFNEQEYLKACLIRDMLNAKGMVATYVNITEVMKKEKEKLQQEVEDWKFKCGKMDDEMCELKKENVRLKEKEVKVIPLLEAENKREEYIKELENKIKLLTEDNDILNNKLTEVEKENKELSVSISRRNKKVLELEKSQETHIKQYKELLDKYDIATAMNKSALDKKEVKRGRPPKGGNQ